MNNQTVSDEALRKRKRRAMETADERESRLSKDRERKRKKVEEETKENRANRLEYQRKKAMQRRTTVNDYYNKSKMQLRPRLKNNQKPPQHKLKHPKSREISQNLNGNTQQTFELLLPPAAELSMAD